ncbi:hypothetical protein B0H16DRAFT_85206 [Mycena metata]|uniref:Extracellular membrane protein CFEM domain-containing protein n=1 Tax=Mycena metata TaxID=1033252 RepID=A0AAD7JZL1_9AGAR|nr:hypothetical protein B0H16DRAFT_85206 [Mycena metata]
MVGRRRDPKQVHEIHCPCAFSYTFPMQRATLRRFPDLCDGKLDNQAFNGPCVVAQSTFCANDQDCTCSNVAYILQAACDACDSTGPLDWSKYASSKTCSEPTPSLINPTALPDSTATNAVASWVIAMVEATPTPTTFNIDDAYATASAIRASSSVPPLPSQTTSSLTASTHSTTSSSTQTASSDGATSSQAPATPIRPPLSGSSKKSSSAGAVAGGIIGALVVLALVGVGIWLLRRRRRNAHTAPSAAYKAAMRARNASPMPYQPVRRESPKNSSEHTRLNSDDSVRFDRPSSPWRPVSIRSESRFHEHTS